MWKTPMYFLNQSSLFQLLHPCESSFWGKSLLAFLDLQHLWSWKHGRTLNHTCFPSFALEKHIVLVIGYHQEALMGTWANSIDGVLIKDQCAVANLHLSHMLISMPTWFLLIASSMIMMYIIHGKDHPSHPRRKMCFYWAMIWSDTVSDSTARLFDDLPETHGEELPQTLD